MEGLIQLTKSKKGITFGGYAAAISAMMLEGSLPVDKGVMYLTVVTVAHQLAQGLADMGRRRESNINITPPAASGTVSS